MYFYDWTYVILIPGIIITMLAQMMVQNTFKKYAQVASRKGITARQLAEHLLAREGINNVPVEKCPGHLSDHYDPRNLVLRLSESTCDTTSVAALGVAAHECGHVLQHRDGYAPLSLRTLAAPVVSIGSNVAWPLFVLGLVLAWEPLLYTGILLFAAVVAFSVITLPVEFNASRRAIAALENGGYLTDDEIDGARKVLNAAALTYVASAAMAVLQLVRLLVLANRRRD